MVIHYNSNASIFFSIIIVVTYLYREIIYREIIYLEITQLWSTTKVVFFFFRNDLERIDLPRKNLFFVDVVRVYQVLLPPVQAVQVGIPQGKRP